MPARDLDEESLAWLRRLGAAGGEYQAAGDAMLAVLAKLADFRGESRFITWAYRFVVLEVSAKLGRHYCVGSQKRCPELVR